MLNWYRKLLLIFTGTSLVIMSLLVIIQVFFRYVLNDSLSWTENLARYFQIYVTFLGAAIALRKGMLISIDLVLSYLKEKTRLRLIIFNYTLVTLFSLFLITVGTKVVLQQITYGQVAPLFVSVPMYLIYLAIPIGGVFLFIESILYIVDRYKELKTGEVADKTDEIIDV